jgi:hypothetical protein
MSTLLYADLTAKHQADAPSGGPGQPVGSSTATFADAVAALVPAEVISLAAVISSLTVEVTPGPDGGSTSVITNPRVVEYSFYALVAISAFLYLVRKRSTFTRIDIIRTFIPPVAFVCWTMLQTNTAVDVIAPDFAGVPAIVTALIVAVLLTATSAALSSRAQHADPASPVEAPPTPAPAP